MSKIAHTLLLKNKMYYLNFDFIDFKNKKSENPEKKKSKF